MINKRIRLPKEGLVGQEDRVGTPDTIDDTTDVEGHGFPTTAPPSIGTHGPGHGGELRPDDDEDDVEGHRR